MPGRGRPADKRRLGRWLNHSRPKGREVLSPAGRRMPGRGRPADKRRLGRWLNHSRPKGREVLSPAGRKTSAWGGAVRRAADAVN